LKPISNLVAEWFFRNQFAKRKTKVTWDTIEPPGDMRDWFKCPHCTTKLPFVLHPEFGLGLFAHIRKFHPEHKGE
jgi:hypothetical protein